MNIHKHYPTNFILNIRLYVHHHLHIKHEYLQRSHFAFSEVLIHNTITKIRRNKFNLRFMKSYFVLVIADSASFQSHPTHQCNINSGCHCSKTECTTGSI
jgi:hypothetical protein